MKQGVTILGVHTAETAGERDLAAIRRKAQENGLTFPIAVDNEGKTWKAWETEYWPSVYLVDKKGNVRFRWEGELNFNGSNGEALMRDKIDALLAERG